MEPEVLHFDLIGERTYVRSTDVLRAVLERFPAKGLTLKFLRPLTGPAVLSEGTGRDGAVSINASGKSYVLSNAGDHAAKRVPVRLPRAGTVRGRFGDWHVFAFAPASSTADRIERVFDIVHPELGQTFVVRSIQIHSAFAASVPLIWFRIHHAHAPDRAHLTMRTPVGRMAEITFKLSPKRQPSQSTG
jgi:hypothetical protein